VTSCTVSVVVPVFNPGAFLEELLASLAAQDFDQEWELILADNGTTDGSLQVVEQFSETISVQVVDATARRGPAFARNVGASAAESDWLAFCDADDVTSPGWLSALYSMRESADFIAGSLDIERLNSPELVWLRGGAKLSQSVLHGPQDFLPFALSGNFLIGRRLYLDSGGFDEEVYGGPTLFGGEDIDFSWRLQLAGHTIGYADEAVIYWRFRTTTYGIFKQARAYRRGYAVLFSRFGGAGMPAPPRGDLRRRFWWVASRLPFVVMGTRRRLFWVNRLGELAGTWWGRKYARSHQPSAELSAGRRDSVGGQ